MCLCNIVSIIIKCLKCLKALGNLRKHHDRKMINNHQDLFLVLTSNIGFNSIDSFTTLLVFL